MRIENAVRIDFRWISDFGGEQKRTDGQRPGNQTDRQTERVDRSQTESISRMIILTNDGDPEVRLHAYFPGITT